MSLSDLTTQWYNATASLPWGVARAFHDAFELAKDEKFTLVYGADFRPEGPCLVNTVGSMLKATGGKTGYGIPSQKFSEIVSLFDRINGELFTKMVNTQQGYVSPLAAEVFLHHFAPIKTYDEAKAEWEASNEAPFIEPTDEQMSHAMETLFSSDQALEFNLDNFAEINRESNA